MLAFCAGFINSVTILGMGHYAVSHMTGTISYLSIAISQKDYTLIKNLSLILISFFLGGVLSGYIIRGKVLYFGRRYGIALVIESLFLFIAATAYRNVYIFAIMTAAFACGLQNAMVTTYSDSIIRTTHLTGLITDISSSLGNIIAGKKINYYQVILQFFIIISFSFGVLSGSYSFIYTNFKSLYIPSGIIFIAGVIYIVVRNYHSKINK